MARINKTEVAEMKPRDFRELVRKGLWTVRTQGVCRNYAQANLAVVPKEAALEFLLFCYRNPRLFPLLNVTEAGNPEPKLAAPGADLRTDLPRYKVFEDGKIIDEPTDILKYWRDDLVCFLGGMNVGVERALLAAGLSFRFAGGYNTKVECIPVGRFKGHMYMSCRVFKNASHAVRAIHISSRLPLSHGAPVHIGDLDLIGIKDLLKPDVNIADEPIITPLQPGEVPLFWTAGGSFAVVAQESELPFMITHYPGYMFVTDIPIEEQVII
jgi:uncharacterized protein YcsI (UPF0317 family)